MGTKVQIPAWLSALGSILTSNLLHSFLLIVRIKDENAKRTDLNSLEEGQDIRIVIKLHITELEGST